VLYGENYTHPGEVFYVMLARVALGHQVQTGDTAATTMPEVFAQYNGQNNVKELANIPGLTPAQPYHSLLGTCFPRFREFIVFNSKQILPAVLIAYHREQ
jgi:hypothetical protein